jgi:hypothetical protein
MHNALANPQKKIPTIKKSLQDKLLAFVIGTSKKRLRKVTKMCQKSHLCYNKKEKAPSLKREETVIEEAHQAKAHPPASRRPPPYSLIFHKKRQSCLKFHMYYLL